MKKTHLFSKAVAGICMIAICVTLPGYPVVSAKTAATVRLNKTKLEMTQGQKYKLKVTGIKKAKITFKSSAPSVASVNKSGNVTAKKKGSAKSEKEIQKDMPGNCSCKESCCNTGAIRNADKRSSSGSDTVCRFHSGTN